jgi:hypothetical protein
MRKTMLTLAVIAALGPIATSIDAAAAPPDYNRGDRHSRSGPYWNNVPRPGTAYWGTFNDVYNNPTGYHCGGGAYISCAPNW